MTEAIQYLLSWQEAAQAGAETVGGKGWNLGRLQRYGFKITPGAVLITKAYNEFIVHNELQILIDELSQQITSENLDENENRLRVLRERILTGTMPPLLVEQIKAMLNELNIKERPLAIRSSASTEDSGEFSFAGIHESFLNVCNLDQVQESIKGCYASLWTPQAVAYRRRFNLNDSSVQMAVVIMEMVDATAAGVAFSCDPQTGRRDRLVIQANYGLGESVVNGAIEPDCYYLDASAWYALPPLAECKIGHKEGMTRIEPGGGTVLVKNEDFSGTQVLTNKQIGELGLLVLRVFEAIGEGEQHLDIEWAYDGRDFVLLQARPVTALPSYTFEGFKGKKEFWSNGNYREAVPMVLSPLHRRVMKNIIDTIQFNSLAQLGYPVPEGFQFSCLVNGRLYCNISALMWSYWDCSGSQPRDFTPFWGGHQPDAEVGDGDPYQGEQGQIRQQRAMKGFALMMEAGAQSSSIFSEVKCSVELLSAGGFSSMPDNAFIELFEEISRITKDYSEKFNFLSGTGSMAMIMLMQKLGPYFGERTLTISNGLMVGGESGITSADHGYRLMELAEMARADQMVRELLEGDGFDPIQWESQLPDESHFKVEFKKFIGDFGNRAVYELEIMNPRWYEDPTYLFDHIRSSIASADLTQWKAKQKEKCLETWNEVVQRVPEGELEGIKQGVKDAQAGAAIREMTKSVLVTALKIYRMMALELGRRVYQKGLLNETGDIFFCSWPDLMGILWGFSDGAGLNVLVADRKALYKQKEMMAAPDVIMGDESIFSQAILNPSGNYLMGVGAAAGKASGSARLINHPAEGSQLQPGEVLVTPSTDPSWTPLFLKASALIMETGGYLSHGSIVAREYGVPAVVNVRGVMKQIKDGQRVTVDGDEGRVYLG